VQFDISGDKRRRRGSKKWNGVFQFGMFMHSLDITFLIDLDINLLQIQIYSLEADSAT
jgi:hypothetical protein